MARKNRHREQELGDYLAVRGDVKLPPIECVEKLMDDLISNEYDSALYHGVLTTYRNKTYRWTYGKWRVWNED